MTVLLAAHAGIALANCKPVGPAYVGDTCSTAKQSQATSTHTESATTATTKLRSMINNERSSRGIGWLERNAQLERIAIAHAKRMAAAGRIYHNDALFYSSTINDLGNPSMLGENVGRGTSSSALHESFMASPEHRANILENGYREFGIATYSYGGQLWVVETFMSRASGARPSGSYGEDTSPLAKSHVLRFSGPAIDSWRYIAPESSVAAGGQQVLGVSRTITSRVPGGTAGIVVVMTFAMVLGAAIPRSRDDGEYV
ncbi:MAG: CAP domain-containing protein [Actinomycetota bacterium]|nr:CAP domain-containing protein [Actinomycetota bacterium]